MDAKFIPFVTIILAFYGYKQVANCECYGSNAYPGANTEQVVVGYDQGEPITVCLYKDGKGNEYIGTSDFHKCTYVLNGLTQEVTTGWELVQRQVSRGVMGWRRKIPTQPFPLEDAVWRGYYNGLDNHLYAGRCTIEDESHIQTVIGSVNLKQGDYLKIAYKGKEHACVFYDVMVCDDQAPSRIHYQIEFSAVNNTTKDYAAQGF